jgi:uncharacterized membrane protein HdeD (DUF308 family)
MNGYEQIRRHAGWFIALGVALIFLGVIAMGMALTTTLISVIVFGWLLLVGGIVESIHAFRVRPWTGLALQLLIGLLHIFVGLLLIANPGASALALTLVLASFFVVGGVFRMIVAAAEHVPGRSWAILNGAINIALGVMIWAHWPTSAFWVIGMFIAVDLIFTGWWFIMLARSVRRQLITPAM